MKEKQTNSRKDRFLMLILEIEVNGGRILTELQSREVNILPLFTEISSNNCFSIYTHEVTQHFQNETIIS